MDNLTDSRSTAEDVAAASVDRMGSLDKALEDSGNDALRGPKAVAAVQVLPEGYLPLATRLGLALPDATTSSLLQIESFDVLKAKVRQLALHSGFQVKLDGRSDKRRQWKCTSHRSCPFSIVGNRNRYGIFVKPHLPHNHAFHLACIVRRSVLFANHDLFHISGMQIANCIFDVTGFHINQMRASRIKRMLLEDPDGYASPGGATPDSRLASSSSSFLPAIPPTSNLVGNNSQITPDSVAWECFVVLANDPLVFSTLGMANVKKMVATFRRDVHKPTLRAILRMSVHDDPASPSGNRPVPAKFVDAYQRQVALGFFDDIVVDSSSQLVVPPTSNISSTATTGPLCPPQGPPPIPH
ncbi:hypothetical protein DYB26_010861 [Aphanomyces astaci]|uniref:Uncharacterized protein n=1 Tax=Aphanomyces astaci TaxID=112090 RepID=A0A418CV79_APHAT|nr:hypothetical protein DYB26_010861 [Aphanomyces astaci]